MTGNCPTCGGTGHEAEPGPTGEPVSLGPCPTCGGSGEIGEEQPELL